MYIFDIEMPDMTGLELAKELRQRGSKALFVFLTGYSQYVMDVFDVFTFAYIQKPITIEKLESVRRTVIMENKEVVLTFTVAECGEYHNLGEYHEGIRTLEEAVAVYEKIPPERMNGNPQVQEAVKEIIRLFPDKEVIDY